MFKICTEAQPEPSKSLQRAHLTFDVQGCTTARAIWSYPKSAEGSLAMFKMCIAPQRQQFQAPKVRRGLILMLKIAPRHRENDPKSEEGSPINRFRNSHGTTARAHPRKTPNSSTHLARASAIEMHMNILYENFCASLRRSEFQDFTKSRLYGSIIKRASDQPRSNAGLFVCRKSPLVLTHCLGNCSRPYAIACLTHRTWKASCPTVPRSTLCTSASMLWAVQRMSWGNADAEPL